MAEPAAPEPPAPAAPSAEAQRLSDEDVSRIAKAVVGLNTPSGKVTPDATADSPKAIEDAMRSAVETAVAPLVERIDGLGKILEPPSAPAPETEPDVKPRFSLRKLITGED